MIRRPPRSTLDRSSAASDVYKRQEYGGGQMWIIDFGKFEWIQNKSKSLQFKLLGNRIHGIFQMIEIEKDQWLIEMKSDFKPSIFDQQYKPCLLYTSPSPRDRTRSRMPSSA